MLSLNQMDDMIQYCCKGDQGAQMFCSAFWNFSHGIDDFIDRDNPSFNPRSFVKNLAAFVLDLSLNPFFQQHKFSLIPVMVQAMIAWGDSMEWEKSGDSVKVADAAVLKGWYHEVFYHVAFIVGGIDHAQRITKAYRKYDHEDRGSNYGMVR